VCVYVYIFVHSKSVAVAVARAQWQEVHPVIKIQNAVVVVGGGKRTYR